MANNNGSEKEDRQFQLDKQLHEQFAVNDNNKTNNVISFLAAIFSVFVGYGVVFYQYSNNKEASLVMATIASLLILSLVCVLCLFFGYSTRREQFVTQKIREKYGIELHYTNPFKRNSTKWRFLPDYYSIMLYACIVFMVLLTFVTVLQLLKTEENFCLVIAVIAAFVLLLLIVYYFMGFYFKKHEEFKNRFTETNNSNDMNKTDFWERESDAIRYNISKTFDCFVKAWNYICNTFLLAITVVVVVSLLVILSNIILYSCNHLEFYCYNDSDPGIITSENFNNYLTVWGTFIMALLAAFAFWESLKMRRRSSFNAVFTQLLSNHVAIFKDVAESNPASESKKIKIKTTVFAGFYDYYTGSYDYYTGFYDYYKGGETSPGDKKKDNRPPMNAEGLQKVWNEYCEKIPDGIKFNHAFKYVFHEVKTVCDEYSTDRTMRNQYIKIIQANMSQDELFCYLINLLQHYLKYEEKDEEKDKEKVEKKDEEREKKDEERERKEIEKYFKNLKESNFFEDLIRKDGKYCPVICELQNIPKLQSLFLDKLSVILPKRVDKEKCALNKFCEHKCSCF